MRPRLPRLLAFLSVLVAAQFVGIAAVSAATPATGTVGPANGSSTAWNFAAVGPGDTAMAFGDQALGGEPAHIAAHRLGRDVEVFRQRGDGCGSMTPELLQELAHVYAGPDVRFPPMDDPPPGSIVRITVDHIGGVGPWTGDLGAGRR